MNAPLGFKLLSRILACSLLSPMMPVQASEPYDHMTVTLEQMVQFLDPKGEEVLIPSGTYSVKVGPEELTLTTKGSTPWTIEATEGTHSTDVAIPTIVSTSGEAADLPNSHLLVILYPDRHTLQAVGTYPKITSRGMAESNETSLEYIDPAMVTFGKPVHFIAPDGNPVIVQPGTYTAEAASPWIRLIPGHDRQKALLIEARQGTHDTGIEDLLALSLPGGILQELDLHQVMLLLPTGQSLEAQGSYSGIQERGSGTVQENLRFKKRNNFLKKVGNSYNKINQTAQQPSQRVQNGSKPVKSGLPNKGSATKWAAGQAGNSMERAANATWNGMKYVANYGQILTCKSTFWTASRTAWQANQARGRDRNEIAKHLKNPKFLKRLQQSTEQFVLNHQGGVKGALEVGIILGHPKNLQLIQDLTDPDRFCTRSLQVIATAVIYQIRPQLRAMSLRSGSEVRSRIPNKYRMIGATVGGQFGLIKSDGGVFGTSIGVNLGLDGSISKRASIVSDGWVGTDSRLTGTFQIGYWGSAKPPGGKMVDQLKGDYIGMDIESKKLGEFLRAMKKEIPFKIEFFVFWEPKELLKLARGQGSRAEPIGCILNFIKNKSF